MTPGHWLSSKIDSLAKQATQEHFSMTAPQAD
jgi:hypothetical protein